ncbi:MAG: NPCBM/NEW2 domain-containing protein [Planctomycetes bacterium]|nr:NPCBM/NEW2 domain-containing protein [Planctomycetota bacterium]
MSLRLPTASFVLGVLLAAGLPAQVVGTVDTVDGRHLEGAITVAESGDVVVTTATGEVRLQVAELMGLVPAKAAPRRLTALHRVWLRSGAGRPCVELAIATGEGPAAIAAELPCGAKLRLPIGMLHALRHAGATRPEPALFAADLREPAKNDDLLFVTKDEREQRSAVRVTGASGGQVAFDLRGKSYEFAFDGVAAIVFGQNTGFAPDRQPKPRTVVELTTGERLEGRLLALDEQLRLRLDEGVELAVPAKALMRMSVASDRLVRLSELTPKVEQTPAFDRVWPWTVDRAIDGGAFQLGGRQYERGIGMVPLTRLTYDLGGRFDSFEATIGIDDRGGPAADAVFRVFVEDRLAFEQKVDRRSAPQQISIDLARCQRLALEVDFGANYDLGDHCVFADARVVQK